MKRKLASVQTILDIRPVPNSDHLEVADILGWKVCVKKGEFKVGDRCVYVETDSVLPERPEFEFLRNKNFRIKIIRLRGQISMGICFPMSMLPIREYFEGDDVTELLGITKFEPPLTAQLSGQAKGLFPSFIVKTDLTRIQAVPNVLRRHEKTPFFIMEKADGSSCSMYLNDGVFGVCSRNIDLKDTQGNTFWNVSKRDGLEETLRKMCASGLVGHNCTIQGELIGPGIQKNKYNLKEHQFRAFRIYNISHGEYLGFDSFVSTCAMFNISTVPIIKTDFILGNITVDELVQMAIGNSVLNPDIQREGLVFRSMIEERDEDLGQLTFKAINPEYLLKYNE